MSENLDILQRRLKKLQSDRSEWVEEWRRLSQFIQPANGSFSIFDKGSKVRRFNKIIDSEASRALDILTAGMMSSMSSSSRQWFKLSTFDPELDESSNVKLWLSKVNRLLEMVFEKSNTYSSLHRSYFEDGLFGTSVSLMLEDFNTIFWHYDLTAGEYCLATNDKAIVDTLYREIVFTIYQMVRRFGYKNCSKTVQRLYDQHQYDEEVIVVHVIEPRLDRNIDKVDSQNMEFKSVYFEAAATGNQVLRSSGYKDFPAVVARWKTIPRTPYGISPAMLAIGDVKQLQHAQIAKGRAIDYQTNPPIVLPESMRGQESNLLPGGVSYSVDGGNDKQVHSAFDLNFNLQYSLNDIQDTRERIKSSFYVDMFLMLSNQDNRNMTATEVAERHSEKLTILGPTMESQHTDKLAKIVNRAFMMLVRANLLPPPPEELQGKELNVEFVSVMAQAQKAVSTNSVDRFVATLGTIAQMKPDVLDNLDADAMAQEYADMLGVNPSLILSSEKVAIVRQQRQEMMQQQAQLQNLQQSAQTAQTLSQTNTEGDNALATLINAQQQGT